MESLFYNKKEEWAPRKLFVLEIIFEVLWFMNSILFVNLFDGESI